MNFLSRIIPGRSASVQKNIVTLSPGEFSIIRREDSPQGRRELIFKNAELALVSTSREYIPQITISDLNNEEVEGDDAQSIDPDDSLEFGKRDEDTFLVHPDIKLGYYLRDGRVAVAWQDLEGDEGDRFEFLCTESVSKEALDRFDREAGVALYSQKLGKKPPSNISDAELSQFFHDYEQKAPTKIAPDVAADAVASGAEGASGEAVSQHDTSSNAREFSNGTIKVELPCDLCIFDAANGVFVSPKSLQGVKVVIVELTDFNYFLEVRNDSKALLGVLTDNLNQFVDSSNNALIFNYEQENGLIMSYLLKFSSSERLFQFEQMLTVAQYESSSRTRWSEIPENQRDFLSEAISGFHVGDSSDYDGDGRANHEYESDDEEALNDNIIDVDAGETDAEDESAKNSALEVGHVNDRTYVLRGDKIGVFKNTDRDLQFSTTIDHLKIDPSRIMLHEQDRSLVIQGKDNVNTLYRMDLETGKIVDEWNPQRHINDFNPISKFAPTTAESNLYCVSGKSMFRIDPREAGGGASRRGEKKYSRDVNFTHVVTTAAGHMVVGNAKGELRLYSQLGKNATTLIPGLGEPLVGLDVSGDGRYILATFEKFLLLVQTHDGPENEYIGGITKDERTRPRKLMISPENVVFMYQQSGQPIKFTTARFNSGPNCKEATIVTSTGPYLVVWSLSNVLRGYTNSYRIKKYKSEITSENFKFGTDRRVILTLEDDVDMVAKSALKKPDDVLKASISQ